jgi:hypothetical protein
MEFEAGREAATPERRDDEQVMLKYKVVRRTTESLLVALLVFPALLNIAEGRPVF